MPFAGFDPANYPLNNNEWSFPLTEIFHIIAFALLIGSIAMVDLRLLGLGMKRQTAAEVLRDTAPWTLLGLVMILITGPLIFFSDPLLYIYNQSFRYKITTLVIGVILNWTLHRKVALSPNPGTMGAVVGAVSLLLWSSLIFAGIFIAFV